MNRIEQEKKIVGYMIRLYCRKKEGNGTLCAGCKELEEYAYGRLEHCPFGERKGACKYCSVHCYRPEMRERMQKVMRFAGPRMLWHRPGAALRHLLRGRMKGTGA